MTSANLDRSLIPPDELRFRVANSLDPDEFWGVGERCANDLRTAISSVGRNVSECKEVLDFGCGSGRTLRWFTESRPRFYGSDMDAEAIGWRENHLAGMAFVVNQAHSVLLPAAAPEAKSSRRSHPNVGKDGNGVDKIELVGALPPLPFCRATK